MVNTITAVYDEATKTATVTFKGETRTFSKCFVFSDGRVCVFNVLASKFRTGSKLWPCEVIIEQGKTYVQMGGYSNKGGAYQLVGWWNDASKYNTQAKGIR